PIYVNAYLPPQPTMERCYAFGQAIARTVTAMGLKTVILASGGMSHFPGTDRYSNPELAWDTRTLEQLAAGKLKSLIGFDESELDETGNIELRCWACAAGALGERKPDVVSMDPSWHHNYASLAWIESRPGDHSAHYPSIKPELVELTSALHGLAHDADKRAQYVADAPAYADQFKLPPDQRDALINLDMPAIVKMGAHPLVPFLAQLQIQPLRPPRRRPPRGGGLSLSPRQRRPEEGPPMAKAPAADARPSKEQLDDLVIANKILFRLNILDAFGHISVRDDRDPKNRYLMSRHLPPGMVTEADIVTFDLDSNPLTHADKPQMSERFIHGEIYKVRPDVISVVHCHARPLIPFANAKGAKLQPMFHMCGFLGCGVPVFEIRDTGGMTD